MSPEKREAKREQVKARMERYFAKKRENISANNPTRVVWLPYLPVKKAE